MRTLFDFLVHEVLIIAQWRYRIFLLAVVIFILLLFSVRSMFLFAIAGIHVMSTVFFFSLVIDQSVGDRVCMCVRGCRLLSNRFHINQTIRQNRSAFPKIKETNRTCHHHFFQMCKTVSVPCKQWIEPMEKKRDGGRGKKTGIDDTDNENNNTENEKLQSIL